MKHLVSHALEHVIPQFRLNIDHGWHGIAHWSRVWRNARELCEVMGVNATVPCLFSYLHDSQRFDEGSDIEHGPRAVEWLERLYCERKLNIKANDFHLLTEAIAGHSDGGTDAHPIVQICWDSDRLDLGRVGIMPNPDYLCTDHAKKAETIQRAWNRSIGKAQSSTFEKPSWI